MEERFPLSRPGRPLFPFSSSGANLSIPSPPPPTRPPSLVSATGSGQRTRPTMPVSAHPCCSPCRGGSVLAPRRGRTGTGTGRATSRGAALPAGIDRSAGHEPTIDRSISRLAAAAAARQKTPSFFSAGLRCALRRSIHRSPVAARQVHTLIQLQPR
ncbi:hypothetical protein BDA96_04G087300 [Sorghum bicolor]|uniref:Uncharacterized protein n=1 Tax=Sorghum bicolor TaxID=4558 RepID=A0A921R491_SORBI|nr:hypothetical protein BDA96_04G087300 [Sorghum bicolor]